MGNKLKGKVALITGSGRGIGRELALMLAKDGAHIVVNDLDADPAHQTVEDITAMGGKAVATELGNDYGEDQGEPQSKTARTSGDGGRIRVRVWFCDRDFDVLLERWRGWRKEGAFLIN